jgi:hypothetical protein
MAKDLKKTCLDHIFNFTCWLERHHIIKPRNFVEAIYPQRSYTIAKSVRYCLNGIADRYMLYHCKSWSCGDSWPEFRWMTKEGMSKTLKTGRCMERIE